MSLAVLHRLGKLTRWESWPPALQALVNTLYPAYIVFNAVKRLRSSDRLDEPMQRRFVVLLAASCVAASLYASRKRAKTG